MSRFKIFCEQRDEEFPLISDRFLRSVDKILFIGSFAIGDYAYLQTYFHYLSQKYPHLRIDLFRDEIYRTWQFSRWKYLKNYALYDWLEAAPHFHKIYRDTYSPLGFRRCVREASDEQYPLVISLDMSLAYGRLARRIAGPDGLAIGLIRNNSKHHFGRQLKQWLNTRQLDRYVVVDQQKDYKDKHISQIQADWFEKFFGLVVPEEQQRPFLTVPDVWKQQAFEQLKNWGIPRDITQNPARCLKTKTPLLIFVNAFAKCTRRCWPLENVAELIKKISQQHDGQCKWVVNAPPSEAEKTRAFFASWPNVSLFSAEENFFQLPAMLSWSDVIISVDTSTVHLSSALQKPLVSLIRQENAPWKPSYAELCEVVLTHQPVIRAIGVDEVARAFGRLMQRMAAMYEKTAQQKQDTIISPRPNSPVTAASQQHAGVL